MSLMRFGDLRVAQARWRHEVAAHQSIEVRGRRRVVRQHAGEHLVHRDAERVDVAREQRLALELLGRHVRRTADDGRPVRGDFQETRCAEIGDLDQAAVGDEHVRRPQIAMQHVLTVRVIDGVADLTGVVERERQRRARRRAR